MIAKIKLIEVDNNNYETIHGVYKRNITWIYPSLVNPQVGMTVIIPQEDKSFRFYITHIVTDLRGIGEVILIDRRRFNRYEEDRGDIKELANKLIDFGWEKE